MPAYLRPSSLVPVPDLGQALHELDNAFAPILLSVELLRRRSPDPDIQRQLDLMAGHAWRGVEIARRILAGSLGRGAAGRRRRRAGKAGG